MPIDFSAISEVHFSGLEQREEEGFIVKEILRTGEWPVIPTRGGKVNKPLRIVRDGVSDKEEGRIAMQELVANFKAGALDRVQIPLSNTTDDHKNITATNTGYIRDLWITDEGDQSKLVAKMEFTEPEVKDKVLRGTYADVSCGIPWHLTSRGKEFGAVLEHVAITNRPFIDGLGPFLALSDGEVDDLEVAHFGDTPSVEDAPTDPPVVEEEPPAEDPNAPLFTIANSAVSGLGLGAEYQVSSASGNFQISNPLLGKTWIAPWTLTTNTTNGTTGSSFVISPPAEWKAVEDEVNDDAPVEETAPRSEEPEEVSELEAARRLRELRMNPALSQPVSIHERSEDMTTLSREELDRLELSDEQRAAIQSLVEENARLSAVSREADADRRIVELSDDLGLKERPGFLKFYRQVMLSDDGGPAAVLLSEDNSGSNEQVTALEILDRALEALKGSDGKVVLSDQALVSGNDNRPPASEGDDTSVEDRLADAKQALYGKK